jgi:hypothetical protein
MSFEVPNNSPFWQKPGRYWELIPLVPYTSYKEYEDLRVQVMQDYTTLIREGMAMEYIEFNNSQNHMLHLGYIGLMWEVKHLWVSKGKDIFLKLTKGVGTEWCELVNSFLVHQLDTALRTHMYCKLQFPVDGFDTAMQETCDYLLKEANAFIKNRNLNPMGYYSFHFVNFKHYRSSNDQVNYGETDLGQFEMPMALFQQIMTAFTMGSHARLGERSCVQMLDAELMRLVFKFEIFNYSF